MTKRLTVWWCETRTPRARTGPGPKATPRQRRTRVRILALDGHFWKWRMQGGALELADASEALLRPG